MVRFIYLTDTHIGADPMNNYQKPAYPEKIQLLISSIHERIEQDPIDFVIHGGDLVNPCQPESIKQANKIFKFKVPSYLCLGNHDLDQSSCFKCLDGKCPSFIQIRCT